MTIQEEFNNRKALLNERREEILKAIDDLNKAVGTPEVDEARRIVLKLLPVGYHLDFGLLTSTFCVVDHKGARVL